MRIKRIFREEKHKEGSKTVTGFKEQRDLQLTEAQIVKLKREGWTVEK